MELHELKAVLESYIFVAEEPVSENDFTELLQPEGVQKDTIRVALQQIELDWNTNPERGLQLMQVGGGYQFRTKEVIAPWLKRLAIPKPVKLSQPALETLAIIAYKQPCIRGEIEEVRGVDSGGVIKTLIERGLVKIVGRRDEAGQPLLYGTTPLFLEVFGLKTMSDLPSLLEVQELMQKKEVMTDAIPAQSKPPREDEGDFDGDEPTEAIMDDDEDWDEPTDLVDDEDVQEEQDIDDIEVLEQNLKNLRDLEKHIFESPRVKEELSANVEEANQASESEIPNKEN